MCNGMKKTCSHIFANFVVILHVVAGVIQLLLSESSRRNCGEWLLGRKESSELPVESTAKAVWIGGIIHFSLVVAFSTWNLLLRCVKRRGRFYWAVTLILVLTAFVSSSVTNGIFISGERKKNKISTNTAIFALILGLASSLGKLVHGCVNYTKDEKEIDE